jgi:hypothetical protein
MEETLPVGYGRKHYQLDMEENITSWVWKKTLPVGYGRKHYQLGMEENITSWVMTPEVPTNTRYIYMPVCLIPDSPVPIPQRFIPTTYQSKISLGPRYHQYRTGMKV